MKKLDKLVLKAFIGPFVLTFLVVVFILLMVQMLKYFDDVIGKGLGWDVVGQLLFHFAVVTTPTAMPLAVLLSALIAYGNLGEHFELTAIKAGGISLLRTIVPIFIFVVFLTAAAFYINNNLVPKAALEAYSLIYDIKQKKPALDLREGTFYNGIPDISIKVDQKFPEDDAALKGIVVYDHRQMDGNKDVIKADSGRMYTILNERYLKFELYNGYNYREGATQEAQMSGKKAGQAHDNTLTRSHFEKTQIVFDLSSYDFQRTDKKWFQSNRVMRNMRELDYDIDSITRDVLQHRLTYYLFKPTYFTFLFKRDSIQMPADVQAFKNWRDSIDRVPASETFKHDTVRTQIAAVEKPKFSVSQLKRKSFARRTKLRASMKDSVRTRIARMRQDTAAFATVEKKVDSIFAIKPTMDAVQAAANMARQAKANLEQSNSSLELSIRERRVFEIQWHKILASSMACIAMFLIGAPLGAIIKKGGLGVPFLVSILFFIIYYLLSMQGEKLAKQFTIGVIPGVWGADFILFLIGFIFLRQARNDARLFEADAYLVTIDRVKEWLTRKRLLPQRAAS